MKLTEEWDRLGPVEIDGVPHDIWILDMRVDPRSRGSLIEIKVAAKSPSGRHYIGRFQVETDRLNDEGVARAIETIETVVRGGLPPSARENSF